jgi:hypothetical protein
VQSQFKRALSRLCLATATGLLLFNGSGLAADFYATQQLDGDLQVVDAAGMEASIATQDIVGTRPDFCPSGSYYFMQPPEDQTLLVLSDCATGEEQHTVEMLDGAG